MAGREMEQVLERKRRSLKRWALVLGVLVVLIFLGLGASTAKGETVTGIYTVAVADGKLTVRLHDLGGDDPYATVIAIEIMDASAP